MIQQVNFSIDIMENGKWRIENERKDYVITLYCRAGGHHPAVCKSPTATHLQMSYTAG